MKQIKTNKKIKNLWSLICKTSSVDVTTNTISLFNLIEELGLEKNKIEDTLIGHKNVFVPFTFQIITLWERGVDQKDSELEADMKLELLDPAGEKLQEHISRLKFQDKKARLRAVIDTNGLKVNKPGLYKYYVGVKTDEEKDFEHVTEIPLQINFI